MTIKFFRKQREIRTSSGPIWIPLTSVGVEKSCNFIDSEHFTMFCIRYLDSLYYHERDELY